MEQEADELDVRQTDGEESILQGTEQDDADCKKRAVPAGNRVVIVVEYCKAEDERGLCLKS